MLKGHIFILSVFLEVVLTLYLSISFSGYFFIILFATLSDAILGLRDEGILLFLIIGAALLFVTFNHLEEEVFYMIILFFICLLLYLIQIKKELENRSDAEILYDRIRKANYELEGARERLMDYSKQVEKVSQLEERNRISRELHDSIGHDLTGIFMQLDAAINVIENDKDKGYGLLKSARQNVSNSIENVRKAVRAIAPVTAIDSMKLLMELIEKFAEDTGIEVHWSTSGAFYKLYPSEETTLYKNTREALTNSARHGHAKNIDLSLEYQPDKIIYTIEDDGAGTKSLKKGFGLNGMEERIELVGGSIEYSSDKGFRITMVIPRKELM
jgi:signal transduction histidine kinase